MSYSSHFRWLSGSLAALAVAVALGLVLVSWNGNPDGPARFNLIVLTVESFRSDMVSEDLTPRLLALAEERDGVYFRHHRSVSAWTVPNVVALLSGTHPVRQGIVTRGQRLRGAPRNGLTAPDGMSFPIFSFQPFALIESYDGLGLVREPGGTLPLALAELARGETPRGLWYHYLDTHLPHRPTLQDGRQPDPDGPSFDTALGLAPPADGTEASRRRIVAVQPAVPVDQVRFEQSDRTWIEAYYRSEIRAFDRWFERAFDIFTRTGLIRNTVLIVTADHGEELGEEGRVGHASTTREAVLNDAVLNVPMFVWTPDESHRAALRAWAESGVPTDHVDVGGTLPVLLGGTIRNSSDEPPAVALQPRNLVGEVRPAPRYAFTSAAGFAEPDPSRTPYFLISKEEAVGHRTTYRLDWDRIQATADPAVSAVGELAHAIVLPRPRGNASGKAEAGSEIRWIWPRRSGAITFDDIQGHSQIRWSGTENGQYVLAYSAGTGELQLAGEIAVKGNAYSFGHVDRDYWETFVVPYGKVRLRVRNEETKAASEWLTVMLR